MTFTTIMRKPIYTASLLALVSFLLSIQSVLLGPKTFDGGLEYTHYNNFKIFTQSYVHLNSNQDLYLLYPQEHWDYFKYSPTFALAMAPLAYLPDLLGLILWNLLNVWVLFWAIWHLPWHNASKSMLTLGFILLEIITSIQNAQSNALIAGLLLWSFIHLERKNLALASLFIVLSAFIKLFGMVALLLFILYPQKIRAGFYTFMWSLLLFILPLFLISWDQLIFLYQSWGQLLSSDHSASVGLSVSGWLFTWFGITWNKNILVMLGFLLLTLPLLKIKSYADLSFRTLLLASILIWVIIFNHKAESATFIIAACGVAVWYFSQNKSKINLFLLLLTFVLTILSPTDLFPKTIRETWVNPYTLKAFPCILVWLKITWDALVFKPISPPSIQE